MKKILSYITAALVMASTLLAFGCNTTSANKSDKIQIVATIFPAYDWTVNVLGENPANAEVTMLLDKGVDLHSYQPTAEDIIKISNCDLFIYIGGESDEWVNDVLKEANNKDMVVINLMDVLGDSVKEEEIVEGMQAEEEHDHEDGEEHEDADHEEEEEGEYDEHVWLSLSNAKVLTNAIAEAIENIDADNKDVYAKNAKDYTDKLDDLDSKYRDVVANASCKTVLFGDRFPFRYLTDDYDLTYYAAFVGCSAETEASFETIVFLSNKVDELNLKTVLTLEGENKKLAQTIVENTTSKDQKVLTMDSMQSVTSLDVKEGRTYLSIMESNLEVLKEALN